MFHVIVGAIIVIFLLAIITPLFASTPVKQTKSFLSLLGLGEKNEANNDRAIAGFNDFRKKLIECSKYEQDNCLCDVSLNGFNSGNLLTASRQDIKVEVINDGNKITLVKEDIENTACYFSDGKFSLEDFLSVNFDGDGAYVNNEGTFDKDVRLDNGRIYKRSGNLCFVVEGESNLPGKCSK